MSPAVRVRRSIIKPGARLPEVPLYLARLTLQHIGARMLRAPTSLRLPQRRTTAPQPSAAALQAAHPPPTRTGTPLRQTAASPALPDPAALATVTAAAHLRSRTVPDHQLRCQRRCWNEVRNHHRAVGRVRNALPNQAFSPAVLPPCCSCASTSARRSITCSSC